MKVEIGPYIHRWTTISFERWCKDTVYGEEWYYTARKDEVDKDGVVVNYGNEHHWFFRTVDRVGDTWQWILDWTINLYIDRKKRLVNVKIDNYDTWSLDHTLGLITLPALYAMKKDKNGIPGVDLEDLPEEMHERVIAESLESSGEMGGDCVWSEEAWTYVLDKMIWSFEQIVDDEQTIYDLEFEKMTHEQRKIVWELHELQMSTGLKLFGKYYRSLWT